MRNFLAWAALAAGVAACGGGDDAVVGGDGLDDQTDQPSKIAEISGRIEDPRQVTARGVAPRMAVLWQFGDGDGTPATAGYFRAADDVPLTPAFPSGFTLDLTKPPPPEAMRSGTFTDLPDLPPGERSQRVPVRHAMAFLVIYDDRNGNGQFDLLDDGARELVDDVLGVARRSQILWLEGELPPQITFPPEMGRPTPGYNWVMDVPMLNMDLGAMRDLKAREYHDDYFPAGTAGPFGWHPIETPVSVELSDYYTFDYLTCHDIWTCIEILGPPPDTIPPLDEPR